MWSEDIRKKANNLKMQGFTYIQIASKLKISMHGARSLIRYMPKLNKKKRGPKLSLNRTQRFNLRREVTLLKNRGEKVNTTKIRRNCNLTISKTTCWRELNKFGLKYCQFQKRVWLTKDHKYIRSQTITNWFSEGHDWTKTVFTDEKRFSLDGPDSWGTYNRPGEPSERERRICEGGGIMVWLMLMPNGLICHRFIRGIFNSMSYLNLLKSTAIPICKLNFQDDFYFQEDNSRVHKSKLIKDFFSKSGIKVLNWPAKSPDLSIAEDVWSILSRAVYDGPQYYSKKALEEAVNNAIFNLNTNMRDKLIALFDSLIPRMCKVLSKKGDLYNK